MPRRNLAVSSQALACIDLFSELSNEEREKIAAQCNGIAYAPEEIIVSMRDMDNSVYFILSGNVRIATFSYAGKEIAFRDQQAGEFFGEMAAIDDAPRSAHAVSMDASQIAVMTADNFLLLLREHPPVMQKAFTRLATLVRLLSDRIAEFSALGVRNRIRAELLRLADGARTRSNTAKISPVPTHTHIANRISTCREAVTKEIRRLSDSGLIKKSRNCLTITDVEALESIVLEDLRRRKD